MITDIDIDKVNTQLRDASAQDIVRWAVGQKKPGIVTTSMGKNAAVMLHLVSQIAPELPVIWVDSGYNLRDTYLVAERLISQLSLNIHVFSPQMTAERRNAVMGGIPTVDEEEAHREFTRQVKLEPFDRALKMFAPDLWLTGIRRGETEHRKSLNVLSVDGRGILKVAPLFHWSDADVEAYMAEHQLPSCRHYFDPTKVHDGRECGMHTAA